MSLYASLFICCRFLMQVLNHLSHHHTSRANRATKLIATTGIIYLQAKFKTPMHPARIQKYEESVHAAATHCEYQTISDQMHSSENSDGGSREHACPSKLPCSRSSNDSDSVSGACLLCVLIANCVTADKLGFASERLRDCTHPVTPSASTLLSAFAKALQAVLRAVLHACKAFRSACARIDGLTSRTTSLIVLLM